MAIDNDEVVLNDERLEIPTRIDEQPDNQVVDEAKDDSTATQTDDYTEYLKAKGVDPSDMPAVVKLLKDSDQRKAEEADRLRRMEASINTLAMQRQSVPVQREPVSEDELKKHWEKFAAANPFATVAEISQAVTANILMKDRLQAALEDLQDTYADKPDGQKLFDMHKTVALNLLQKEPAKYVGTAGSPRVTLKNLFKDAEREIKSNASFLLKLAGVDGQAATTQTTNNEDEAEERSRRSMSAVMAQALGSGKSTGNLPKRANSNQQDEKTIINTYKKAFADGDVEKMIDLKTKHKFLVDYSVMMGD